MILQTKEGHKICSNCKAEKHFSEYQKCNGFKFGIYSSCKKCVKKNRKPATKEQRKIWQKRNYEKHRESIIKKTREYALSHPEMRRKIQIKHQYGISQEYYENISNSQNGFCAICGKKPTKNVLYIDHCHATNKIRGLLCIKCNSLLGFCNDNISVLNSAITYLQKENHHGYISCGQH